MSARRAFLPESVLLVVAGLVIGRLMPSARSLISADLVLLVLVPGLVFDAAFDLDWRVVRRMVPALAGLAIAGVLLSAATVAVLLNTVVGIPIALAFVVGAITSATDPIAVVATLERLKMPHRLRTLVEGESLLNDGTGLVLVAIAVIAATTGVTAADAAARFVIVIALSVAIGYAVGRVGARVLPSIRPWPITVVASIVYVYVTYAAAAAIGLSGVLVTVVGAMTTGHILREHPADVPLAAQIDDVWAKIAFALSAVAFLAIGVVIDLGSLSTEVRAIAVGVLAVLLARALFVYVPYVFLRGHAPIGWAHVVFWSGLRGAIAFAATLALPADLPERQILQNVCFGIVLVTLVVQGVSAPAVVRSALGRDARS
ncbi:MAG TPA: cation:proton antiporter [Candidatus Limnocylindrales bacterium]|nr:cation:proton antiporter [Candidatus Limnocylindrales bacterium]